VEVINIALELAMGTPIGATGDADRNTINGVAFDGMV
jgi:hypothetical protein